MNDCPCCSSQLLRHVKHHRIYWFCPHCWEEMPNLSYLTINRQDYAMKFSKLLAV